MRVSKSFRRAVAALVVVVALAALAAGGSISPARSAVTAAFVRVNQVGYPSEAPKRAYLMSSVDQTGAAFGVRNASGATVFTGTVGASLGSWSQTYSFVHAARLRRREHGRRVHDRGDRPGRRFLPNLQDRHGPERVQRRRWRTRLSFYQTERDGPNFIANAAPDCSCTSQRSDRDDVCHAARELSGTLLRRSRVTRRTHRCVRRLVGRRGLHQGR